MLFNSPQFLLFFVLVAGVCYLLRATNKRLFLLSASLFFIASFHLPSLIATLFFSGLTFLAGRSLKGSEPNILFYVAQLLNAVSIVLFNYLLSFHGDLRFSFAPIGFNVGSFLLIVGLSFYNLQHIAYLIDVKKKRIEAEKNFMDFLLFSVYFPKFISGPVTLYQQMKTQLWDSRPTTNSIWQGINRMLLGFFKKMVIADRLASSVHSIFDFNDVLPGLTVLAGGILFTIQLYFDFSGYCDIAIGASKVLGIELPENFDFPLRATSITLFWRKWHQTLIHFFTTYIFYPISFKYRRFKKQASAMAIVVTFFVSALWHGVGVTFMLWALCHMTYLLVELYIRKPGQPTTNTFIKCIQAVFVLVLVSFSHLFFRSTSFENCTHLMSEVFSVNFIPTEWLADFVAPMAVGGHQVDHFNFLVTLIFVSVVVIFEHKIFLVFSSPTFRPVISFLILVLIFLFGVFNNGQRFIYMQF